MTNTRQLRASYSPHQKALLSPIKGKILNTKPPYQAQT